MMISGDMMGVKIQKKKQEMCLINDHTTYFVVKPGNGIFGSSYYQAFLNRKISSSCFCFYCWNISSGLQIISISSILPETEWMTNKYYIKYCRNEWMSRTAQLCIFTSFPALSNVINS